MTEPTSAYLFVHFIGDERNPTDEQLYFALSHDGTHWRDLRPAGRPALTWLGGERGTRDPHIVRDPRGGFHIIATDLSIHHRGGWGPNDGATTNGSTGLVVWDSPDLAHWSEPRLVDVASTIPGAGMAWAPEACWDPDRGQWIVFWATTTNADAPEGAPEAALNNELGDRTNMYYATTEDFRTFSAPVKWIDRSSSVIDTTMIRDDDGWWYRASKDSEITIERTRNPYAVTHEARRTDDPQAWSFVGTLTDILGNGRYSCRYLEGPELFRYNDADIRVVDGRTMAYGLMCDQFGEAKGYLPFRSADLSSRDPQDWAVADDIDFGTLKKRHGAILPITAAEYKAVEAAFAE
ncbi:glycoside hydrolase family 43 protein [Bifidobacterium eulemuris]|uniref:1,4-beta-xylanase n=1 Tax=Bifidobacterium eulemuris TaxID=1765219 RepID=A0A261G653_9BIFI|nr:glycoside hydrolase family 43 protein [Bifidobacterium eulemuris]OZG66486.1 1,4-beta-xylanase [Bifidobacterium eulemuris]QOL32582.1 glycoside hydrolase family 43 protein [Bifidobacterium eulemuris]